AALAKVPGSAGCIWVIFGGAFTPWQRLYFLPLPHGQGSFRPISGAFSAGLSAWVSAICAGTYHKQSLTASFRELTFVRVTSSRRTALACSLILVASLAFFLWNIQHPGTHNFDEFHYVPS